MDHQSDWTLDRVMLQAGSALEYIKTFQRRERELLEANNALLERARGAERALLLAIENNKVTF